MKNTDKMVLDGMTGEMGIGSTEVKSCIINPPFKGGFIDPWQPSTYPKILDIPGSEHLIEMMKNMNNKKKMTLEIELLDNAIILMYNTRKVAVLKDENMTQKVTEAVLELLKDVK
jgi:hypothetical protein